MRNKADERPVVYIIHWQALRNWTHLEVYNYSERGYRVKVRCMSVDPGILIASARTLKAMNHYLEDCCYAREKFIKAERLEGGGDGQEE